MKKLSMLFAFGLATVLATGCATNGGSMGGGSDDYATVVSEAKAEIGKAKKMGGEWRDSGKFLKQAEKAAKDGDMDKAMKLAKKARFQGQAGQKQAAAEKNAGPWLF